VISPWTQTRLPSRLTTHPFRGGFAIVVALYTTLLRLLVPSGGGMWLVEAPYVQSATDVRMNLGWTVQIYNAAEALPPTWVNPLFMLPLLAALGVRARDLIGFTFNSLSSTCKSCC
jgi:short-chain fatty acids transporter